MKTPAHKQANSSLLFTESFYIYPSYYWGIGLVLLHVFVLLAVFMANINLYIQLLLNLWVLLSLYINFIRWYRQPIYRIRYLHNHWCLIGHNNDQTHYKIIDYYFWSTALLILIVVDKKDKTKRLPIVFDSCTQQQFKWLRVIVKHTMTIH